jgi:hypothetical protein
MKQALGCPRGPEQTVHIQDRREGDTRGLWLDDDSALWYSLAPADDPTFAQSRSKISATDFWQAGPDRVVSGAIQEFSGGTLIFLPEPDGRRVILFVDRQGKVRAFPD